MRASVKATLSLVAVSCLVAALPSARKHKPQISRATGTHLDIALSDQSSARLVFTTLVVRPFGKRWLTDGADVWEESPVYDLMAVAMPHSKWEMLELSDANFARGQRDDLFASLPQPGHDGQPTAPAAVFGVRAGYLETALVYASKAPPGSMRGWAPLADVAQYPGARALKDDPEGTLEAVLLSDGVAPARLYPLDVERAFRVLGRMRPSVAVWWQNEADVAHAASAGKVAMAVVPTSFLYRPDWAALHLSVADSGTLGAVRWWVVPKNKPITEEMRQFLAYVSGADEPIGTGGYGLLSPRQSSTPSPLTSSTNRVLANGHVLINEAWWTQNRDSMTSRWKAWRGQSPSP